MAEAIHQLQIVGPSSSQTYTLVLGTTTIGRQQGNDLVLDHFLVSRRHAQIELTETYCQVTDLGSANGMLVNGTRLEGNTPMYLSAGAVIEIGPFRMVYETTAVTVDSLPEPEQPNPPPIPEPEPLHPLAEYPPAQEQEIIDIPPLAVDIPEQRPTPSQEVALPVVRAVQSPPIATPPTNQPPASPPPPPTPPISSSYPMPKPESNGFYLPPGLSLNHSRYLEFLPGIYHTDFMTRFLALLESILAPVEWNVDNFDLYLSPETSPYFFLPWLANWFEITFDDTWTEAQRRTLLHEAHLIYARRGTRWSLSRVLEIYMGKAPEIDDLDRNLEPFTFNVTIPFAERNINRNLIERIIDSHKPAHTTYALRFKE